MTAQLSSCRSHQPRDSSIPRSVAQAVADLLSQTTDIADYCLHNAAAIDHNGAFPVREFELISDAGLLTAPLRPELGGLGLGIDAQLTHDLLVLLKRLGYGNLAVGRIYEGHVNALQLIQTFGTPDQIATYAEAVRDRQICFGVWNAEAADGVQIIPLDYGPYQLQGAKTFCSGAGYVDRPFVNGALPDGRWQMCIVPMDDVATLSDPSWWQPSGMRATASYKVDFSGVELDANALIGQPDDYHRQPWLTAGVIRFAAVQLGAAEALFDLTRRYLQDLNRTDNLSQQERLGRMAIALETGNLWLQGAADQVAAYSPMFAGDPTLPNPHVDQLVAYCNMVRTAIEQICMDMMQLCQRCVGTRGLLPPHSIERIIRDLTLYLRQPAYDAAIIDAGRYALSQPALACSLWSYESTDC